MKQSQDPLDVIKLQTSSLENIQLYMMQMRDLTAKMAKCNELMHGMFRDLDVRLSRLEDDFSRLTDDRQR